MDLVLRCAAPGQALGEGVVAGGVQQDGVRVRAERALVGERDPERGQLLAGAAAVAGDQRLPHQRPGGRQEFGRGGQDHEGRGPLDAEVDGDLFEDLGGAARGGLGRRGPGVPKGCGHGSSVRSGGGPGRRTGEGSWGYDGEGPGGADYCGGSSPGVVHRADARVGAGV